VTELSIIIVNYKTPGLVIDCLETIHRETTGVSYEIIVIDNASGDNSEGQIMAAFPDIRWIPIPYNAGFARANNEGIRRSRGNVVLLLNSDTLIEENAIGNSCVLLAGSPYIACGVQLLNVDRTPQISGNFFMKGGLNYLLPLPYIGNWIKWMAQIFSVNKPNVPEASGLVEVDWINGAYLMVKKEAIGKAGLLDEDFFLYAEEAEWCSRLRRLGPLCIYGQYHVIHLQGASANETFSSSGKGYYNLYDRKGLQIMLSNFVRIRKQFGVGWFLVQLLFYILEIPVFFFGILVTRLSGRTDQGYSFVQFRKYCKNLGQVLARTGTIIRNKPYFYKVL
jgi:GT2 family glycosyltransferase